MISVHTNMFVFEALTYARRSYRSTSGRDSWRTSRQHYSAKFSHVYGENFSAIRKFPQTFFVRADEIRFPSLELTCES